MPVRVNLDVSLYTVREPDPDDYWDAGDESGTVGEPYISTDDYGWGYRGEEIDLELPFYVVYCGYHTGSTFGSTYDGCILTAFKEEEDAVAWIAKAEKSLDYAVDGVSIPWNGYFESLDILSYTRLE